MKWTYFVSIAMAMMLGGFCASARAASAPATQPAAATTRPSVIVYPFEMFNDSSQARLGNAIAEDLASALISTGHVEAQWSDTTPGDLKDKMKSASAAGASAIIVGSIQAVDGQVRINGRIIEVRSGKSLGSLHTQGMKKDLFSLEDILASQSRRALIPPMAVAQNHQPAEEMVSPSGHYQRRYFQQSVMETLAVPARFEDQRDHYNYSQPPDFGAFGFSAYGFGYGGFGGVGSGYNGPGIHGQSGFEPY